MPNIVAMELHSNQIDQLPFQVSQKCNNANEQPFDGGLNSDSDASVTNPHDSDSSSQSSEILEDELQENIDVSANHRCIIFGKFLL